ncbi:MAG: S-layer family protein [Cyanobacteria bacterium J055]|nr:MAG: S-layer family protein [Cyanobacteria bacterium J055]
MTCYLKLGALSLVVGATCSPSGLLAEIVPDATLPEPSRIQIEGAIERITGGTAAGNNLFHSFDRFNLPTGSTAYFDNALTVENIITRVTGGQLSTIDGLIRANGTANLFLLNPNGIVFGPNARLDIGGSFLGSTADSVVFADGSQFSAAQPNAPPLLTVNVPIGLQWNDANAGNILVRGSGHVLPDGDPLEVPLADRHSGMGLHVQPGATLALVGGDVTLDGGVLTAQQGRIELGSVGSGTVSLSPDAAGWRLGYPDAGNFGTVWLLSRAAADVSGDGGGSLQVRGQTVSLADDSRILAETLGAEDGLGIGIETEQLSITGDSFVSTSTYSEGQGGNLEVNARSIEAVGTSELQDFLPILFATNVQNPAQVGSGLYANGFGAGDAGVMNVNTATLSLRQSAFLSGVSSGSGHGGILNINATDAVELLGSEIFVDSLGNGEAGVLNVEARTFALTEGGGIFGSTFGTGRGGIVNVRASESIEISGTTPNGQFNSSIGSNSFGAGDGGFVSVTAPRITIRNGGGISGGVAPTSSGRGATLILRASESLEAIGVSATGEILTTIDTQSRGSGQAGDIEITAGRLSVRDGATISTSTLGSGAAGRLTVRADVIEISGTSPDGEFPSTVSSDADLNAIPPSPFFPDMGANVLGAAGDLTVIADRLIVRDRGVLAVSSAGEGESAGNLSVRANSILLDDRAALTANPETGTGGNISIDAQNIELRRQSTIATNASGTATGGNIAISTDTLVALENSDITANAQTGFGGRVSIDAEGIFGTKFRNFPTPNSDITATSELGAAFSGVVTLQTPDVDPNSGLVQLPENPIDPTQKVTSGCGNANSQFIVTGRGGLPEDPTAPLSPTSVWEDLRDFSALSETVDPLSESQGDLPPPPRVEATGWIVNDAGQVELVARVPSPNSGDWGDGVNCQEVSRFDLK